MTIESPTVASWVLAIRIKRRRLDLGLDVPTVIGRLGVSRPYWSRVENDRAMLSEAKLGEVLDLLRFDGDDRDELFALWELARSQEWFAEYSDLIGDSMRRYYGLEGGASRIRCYHEMLVPGLLQADSYALALIESFPGNRPSDFSRLKELRLRRQKLLSAAGAPRLSVVVSEAVLWQQVGSAEVLIDQLRHLLALVDRLGDGLCLRIHPFDRPLGGTAGAPAYFLLELEPAELPTVAFLEGMYAMQMVDDRLDVNQLVICYEQAFDACLDEEESAALIEQRLRG